MIVLGNNPLVIIGLAALAVLALIVLALLLARRRGTPTHRGRPSDGLDAGAPPARRNEALIASPSAASAFNTRTAQVSAGLAGTGPDIMGGIGELVAAAAAHEVARDTHAASATVAPVGDDLTRLKGVGPRLAARLAELGVTRFAEIAGWSAADIATIDAQLGAFAGRATADRWVEQARLLAAGDIAGFEAMFGKL